LPRIDARPHADLRDFAFDAFLDALESASAIAARHTVDSSIPVIADVATRLMTIYPSH
jgi:hypothetical protein